jgi:hypothetical protein
VQLHLVHRKPGTAEGRTHKRRTFAAPSSAVIRTGLRRVDWVRLLIGSDGNTIAAQVEGVGHRSLIRRLVPVSLAQELIAGGTPYVTRSIDSEGGL